MTTLRPKGLWTDPNPYSAVPDGALRTANNVVLRREGLIEPRPGFDRFAFNSPPASYDVLRLIPFDVSGDTLMIGENAGAWRMDWRQAQTQCTLPSDATTFRTNYQRAARARSHLYLATAGRVVRVRSSGASSATALKSPPVECSVAYTAGSLIADDRYVAFRATVVRRLTASGSLEAFSVESQPSQRATYFNNSGGTTDVTVTVGNLGQFTAGDLVRIYRSVQSATTPPDELKLCHEFELTSTEISAGTYAHTATLTDSELGALLYTNPSQEGSQQANYAPPSSRVLATFRGSLFCAHITQPHRLTVTYYSRSSVTTNLTGSATGIGVRGYTGDTTSGNTTISSLSSVVGLKVGMIVSGSGIPSSPLTYVTAVGASSVTLSAAATATASGVSFTFSDAVWIKRGGTTDIVANQGIPASLVPVVNVQSYSTLTWARADFEKVSERGASSTTEQSAGVVTVQFEARNVTDAAFEIMATHGTEYSPALPEPSVGTGLSSSQEVQPNGLWWSKTDQPESVPLVNFALVGDRSPIRGIAATNDILWIFKDDGLYTLRGYGAASGWSVDLVDATQRLLHPESVVVMGGDVYGWTTQGVIRISPAGIENISTDAIGTDLGNSEIVMAAADLDSAEVDCWLAANDAEHEVLMSMPSPVELATSQTLYVYNGSSRAWVTWNFGVLGTSGINHACVEDGLLVLLDDTIGYVTRVEDTTGITSATGHERGYDNILGFTINSISGTTITIAGGSDWTPAVGDTIYDSTGGGTAVVVSVASSTVFDVDSVTGIQTGSTLAYVACAATVVFQARAGGAPTTPKLWRDMHWLFDSLYGVYTYTTKFTSSAGDTASTQARTLTRSSSTRPRPARYLVPRAHARGHVLYPRLEVTQALGQWRLAGLTLSGKGIASRGTTRRSS